MTSNNLNSVRLHRAATMTDETTVLLTRRGARLPRSPDVMRKVRAELTVSPFSPQTPFPKNFKLYTETIDAVFVPPHWALKAFEHAPVDDARPRGHDVDIEFHGQLRPDLRQPEAVQQVLGAWTLHGGAMLCLPVGFGKTTCALFLACALRKKTLVVVHKAFLAQQWEERIRQSVPKATVSHVRGPDCDTSGDFVIAMMQTLISRTYPPAVFEACGLVIADEVHHIGAEVFSRAMMGLHAPRMLGLTATPERRDRLGKVVEWLVGPIAFQLKREHQTSTHVLVVPYSCPRYMNPPPVNSRGDACFTSIISHLVEDDERTELVAQHAERLARDGRDVLVLSHRRVHCQRVCAMLRQHGVDCDTYLGGDKVVPRARVLVATYALTSEGFDCPRLNALVLATPASDVEQSSGRIMRGSATREAKIVDIVDQWGVCFAQHAKRRGFYRRSGFKCTVPADDRVNEAPPAYAFAD